MKIEVEDIKESRSRILKRIPLGSLMDLKIDYAFKQLFGSEKNKEITVVFLNAILQRTGDARIRDITFSNTESILEHKEDKQSRLDILATTNLGEWINVEIQFNDKYNMVKRSIYYWADIYRSQMQRKMTYHELRPVIAINLLNFKMFEQTRHFHTTFRLFDNENQFLLTDLMEFHFIEMPKLLEAWKEDKLNPRDDVLARWLLLLGMVDRRKETIYEDIFKELEVIAMNDETLRTAFENWEMLSGTMEERMAYQARLKHILDEEAAVREAELRAEEAEKRGKEAGIQKGIQEGLEKGLEEGMEKGLEKGMKKGMKQGELMAQEKVAKRLLSIGMEMEQVAKATELELSRVLEIKEELAE